MSVLMPPAAVVCVICVSSQTCVLQAYAVQGQHAIPQPDVSDSATQKGLHSSLQMQCFDC